MTKKKIVLWTCDYSEITGEGNLAKKFIKDFYQKKNVKIIKLESNNILNRKYLTPMLGIYYCWKNFLTGNKVGYINYLPLWNFIIFILLPPNTILGPITGGAVYSEKITFSNLFRKFLFPIFYKISEFFLNLRCKKNIYFSTDLLKKYLSKKTLKKSIFNYVLKNFSFSKKKMKSIDLLIYYRLHENKLEFFNPNFIKNLIKLGFRVLVVGDKLNLKGVKNLGYVSRKRLSSLQSKSKFTLCSYENIYSLFILECISNHVKIIINKKNLKKIKYFKKNFITFNKIKKNTK